MKRTTVTYDRYWLQTLVMRAPAPGQPADATVVLARYSSADGSLSGETVTLNVQDLFARAANDEQLAMAMWVILGAVRSVAAADGLVEQGA
jgi:hypothetical protein